MKLKFKPIKLEAGRPIAFVNNSFAEKHGIFEGSRIEVILKKKKLILTVNLVEKLLKEEEISFSSEAVSRLKVKKGTSVEVSSALEPRSTVIILKKLNNKELSKKEIYCVIEDIVQNALNEAEVAYFVSAVYHNGMSKKESFYLIDAMTKTGRILKWRNKKTADKHSIGGVPGNRTTPIVVSICAAAGIIMPKTSSRAITSAAGTADVIETVAKVNLSAAELKKVVQKTGASLAWGGSLGLAPSDDKLIRVERLLNLDPEPQLIASIISKKLSVGSKYILIDIPAGEGAKVSREKAKNLKRKFIEAGRHFKLKIHVVITDGSQPIGNGIGPVLEMIDVLKVMKGENGPKDLKEKSISLASKIIEIMNKAKKGECEKVAREILESGKAFKKFNEIIEAQGRKDSILKTAKLTHNIRAKFSCKIKSIHNKSINHLARILGCPASAPSGIYLYKHRGDKLKKGERILTLYSESKKKLNEGIRFFKETKPIKLARI